MLTMFDVFRRRCCAALFGVFLYLFFCATVSPAQTLSEGAPVLISLPDSTRAYATIPNKPKSPVQVINYGGRGIVTLYVTNLDLMKGEGAGAFRADVEDSRHMRFPLSIVSLEQTPERKWVYALTVRLQSEIGDVGDTLVRVTWRGMSSNRVRLSIGHDGGRIKDDAGAFPTPMPDNPPIRQQTEFVSLPYTGDIVRFMEQATFGPTPALEQRLRRTGLRIWLNQQLDVPALPDNECVFAPPGNICPASLWQIGKYPNLPLQQTNPPPTCDGNPMPPDVPANCFRDNYTMYPLQNWFFREALYNEDQQLRRRVSWALSQIFVVSGRETVQPSRMLPYVKTLDRHAFSNFRELLYDMTLNPAMGNYLDMAISTRTSPNENYAREILQLFSIGLFMLNEDGTYKFDAQGNRIPTYDQSVVNGFTKIFTGWTFCNEGCPNSQLNIRNFRDPLISFPSDHDTGEKRVLSHPEPGIITTIPGGLSPQQDLDQAIDNIFQHPNVGPFIGKLLIQHLVTSNPSHAYIQRVAAAFDGRIYPEPFRRYVRGDMKHVIRTILLDPEARGNIKTDPDYGKLREPVLCTTNVMRVFGATAQADAPCTDNLSDGVINGMTLPLDQDVFNPPSVLNYYPMDYLTPNTALGGPEFGIFSTGTSLKRPNFINQMIFGNGIAISETENVICGTRINIARYQSLAASDATGARLVDTLNKEVMHRAMSATVRNEIMTAVQAVTTGDGGLKRARTAIYLVLTAPQYQVQR